MDFLLANRCGVVPDTTVDRAIDLVADLADCFRQNSIDTFVDLLFSPVRLNVDVLLMIEPVSGNV